MRRHYNMNMTRVVIAAVDHSAACRPVLEHAQALAARWDTGVSAVYVDEGHADVVREMASAAGLRVRIVHGEPVDAIVRFAHARDVVAVVVGNGALPGRRTTGHVARELVARCHVPVLVVPPSATVSRFERILVPLEGTAETSAAITRLIDRVQLGEDDAEQYMLHVFEEGTMPRTS
jgi:nucleotide-binding universal stress UspA family protein